MEFVIENQDHAVACLIREQLFNFDIEFGACTIRHPQARDIHVEIRCEKESPRDVLDQAVGLVCTDLDELESVINGYLIHKGLQLSCFACDDETTTPDDESAGI